ncbi:alpha/beta fold hydrolase [Pontibacillus salicampi]|uniref:Alpha/beta fold hydrolase n=1 Tax=Pontibacillus salicampi TaxID=1449801 RepID=A0ABV6LLR8_9BACI
MQSMHVQMRDGFCVPIFLYRCPNPSASTLLLLHGITAEQRHLQKLATQLQTEMNVVVPILRGYEEGERRGDIAYNGQYDDDLLDLQDFLDKQLETKYLYWAGHSMGCANVLRMILNKTIDGDGVVFISPFFHPALPLYRIGRKTAGEENKLYRVNVLKLIWLTLCSKAGIRTWEHSKVLKVPDEFSAKTIELSYRLFTSRFSKQLKHTSIDIPILSVIGSNDEVTHPERLTKWWGKFAAQTCEIIPEEDHNTILFSPHTVERIRKWVQRN